MILQSPFMRIASKMYRNGEKAAVAIMLSQKWFTDREAARGDLIDAHVAFQRNFEDLMKAIEVAVAGEVEAQRYARKIWDHGKTYGASPETIGRVLGDVQGAPDRGARPGDEDRAGAGAGAAITGRIDCARPCCNPPGGFRVTPSMPEGAQAGRPGVQPDVLDYDHFAHGCPVPRRVVEDSCVRYPSCVAGRCAFGDTRSCASFGSDGTR